MAKETAYRYFDRELSWLAFNERVLQEAEDPRVPLLERLKFLAIFSSNLDEFFIVRVASLRTLLRLKKKTVKKKLAFNPAKLLKQIQDTVMRQQERFGEVFRNQILAQLNTEGICLIDEAGLGEGQKAFLTTFFEEQVRPHVQPILLSTTEPCPFLKNRALYLVAELWPQADLKAFVPMEARYALIEVPVGPLPRFVSLPEREGKQYVIFLDDVIRQNLALLFPAYEVGAAYSVKLSRDAELYLDDEFEGDLIEMIRKSLSKRETGLPTRFLYDLHTPYPVVTFLKTCFDLKDEDMILGGRYHNFSDFFGFPDFGREDLLFPPMPPLPHPELAGVDSLLAAIAAQDHLLHFPYQSYDYVTQLLEEAVGDPDVEALWITLYRVASDSAVNDALIKAAKKGKHVTVFVEVKARFDEATNLQWAERLEHAGARVLYSIPGLKVHTKLALIARREAGERRLYAYLGTGNFNEKTARIYADEAILTADPRLTVEVERVFQYLTKTLPEPIFDHLLVAPFYLRKALYRLIDAEIENAKAGREAWMVLKMNSLEDPEIIARLYAANEAGVQIHLIIRGICCLVPGVPGQSENITITSIVGRFLEHMRIYLFHHGGDEQLYLASADWMRRNLNRRVEIAFPVYDERLRKEVRALIDLQRRDNTQARIIDAEQRNAYVRNEDAPVCAQEDLYRMLKSRLPTDASSDWSLVKGHWKGEMND